MSDKKIHALVSETNASTYSVEIEVNGHKLIGDEPESFGSKNLGPAPYDLLLAALGECSAMTVRWFAIEQKFPLEKVIVKLSHEKRARQDYFTKEITIQGKDLSDEQKQKLHDVAAKCPVHRTLTSGNVVIETLNLN
jgi:putative redox protein